MGEKITRDGENIEVVNCSNVRDLRYRPFSTGRSLVHSTYICAGLGFRESVCVFFAYKNIARVN